MQQIQFYEVEFKDGFSIAIKGVRAPSLKEADEFCRYKYGPATGITAIPESEVQSFYDCRNIDNWPIFGLQSCGSTDPENKSGSEPTRRHGQYLVKFYYHSCVDVKVDAETEEAAIELARQQVTDKKIADSIVEECAPDVEQLK